MNNFPIPTSFSHLYRDNIDGSNLWINRSENLILVIDDFSQSSEYGPKISLHGCMDEMIDHDDSLGEGDTWDEFLASIRDHSTPAKLWRADAKYRDMIADLMEGK